MQNRWHTFEMIKKIILLILIFEGWFLIGIRYTIKIGHPTSTILFLGGIFLMIYSIISLRSSLKSKFNTKSEKRKNTNGYIYFLIRTENENFGIKEFENFLTIKPTEFNKMFEKGKTPMCTSWVFSSGKLINPIYFKEIELLIDSLEEHKD